MLILSVDTALGLESCCLQKNEQILGFSIAEERSSQAEKLFNRIDEILDENNLEIKDIDYFAINIGPGSFTGIRIGLAAILGIASTLNKKLAVVTTLQAAAYRYAKENTTATEVHVAIDASRGDAFVQSFKINGNNINEDTEAKMVELHELNESGFKADIGNLDICKNKYTPNAEDIGQAANIMISNNIADFERKEPIYIRLPDAKKQSKKNK